MKQGDTLSLPKGWEIKKLGEVCENLDSKRIPITQSKRTKGDIPYYGASGIVDYVSDYIFDEDLLCVSEDGANLLARTYPIAFSISGKTWVNNHAHVLRFKNFNTQKFIELYLNSIRVDDYVSGMAQPKLNQAMLNKIPIPLPPLPEQQRIVSILDEAFEVIERSRNAAIKNLKNAKELFESYLQGVFEKKGDGWEEQLLEDCFKLKSGDNLTAKNMTEGEYPVFGGNGIAGYHNEYSLSGSNVIIGRVGALCGNVRHITENIWLTDNAFKVVDFKFDFDHSFLTYLLNHKDLRSYARQAAQPVISNSSLKDVVLHFPKSKEEQQTIVRQLDSLRAETQKLEAVYQKKMDDLEELKKSILQKAFAGELRGGEPVELKTEKAVSV